MLTGSLIRVVLGIWSDVYGGRPIFTATMLAAASATFLLSHAHTFPQMLVAALGVGIAGGSFAVGVAYVSRWYPVEKQGTALGIFGAGNVGAAVTNEAVRARIETYLGEHVRRRGVAQYIALLIGQADIRGIALEGAASPLVQ